MVSDNRAVPETLTEGRNGVGREETSDKNQGESYLTLLVVYLGISGFCLVFTIKAARIYVHQVYGKKFFFAFFFRRQGHPRCGLCR